ncbi:MAG: hypothetical protein ACKOEE_12525 [Tagaea sp.]
MTRASILVSFAALTLLGACESRTVWVKESAPPGQLDLDQRDCTRESGNYGYIDRGGVYGLDNSRQGQGGSITADAYRRCMEARGWRRERQGDAVRPGATRT